MSRSCDTPESVYGKYIVRDLSCEILGSAMTWLCLLVAILLQMCRRSALLAGFSHCLSQCDNDKRYFHEEDGPY
jgi:hypothetical protein